MTIQYLAGIVDGEGHFYRPMHRNGQGRGYPQSRIVIINTNEMLIDGLLLQFGGTVTVVPKKGSLGKKKCYRWTLVGKKAEALAHKLKPHLIVKAQQVTRIIDRQ